MQQNRGVRYFPIALFSSVMGFSAVTIVLKNIETLYEKTQVVSFVFLLISTLLFIFNGAVLVYRLIRYRVEVKKDFNHPIQMNFFATVSISLLLLAVLYIDVWGSISFVFWVVGAMLQLSLTLIFLTRLMWGSSVEKIHFTPVSFIPIVGNLVVPLAGIYHVGLDINWFFFGIGIFFSIVYMTLFMNRMFFSESLPDKLIPTLFILLAPPSVGFVSYMTISGELNHFAYILYSIAFFVGLLLLFQLRKILSVKFFISWWSLLFPTAAFTIATIRMFVETGKLFFEWLVFVQISGLFALIIYIAWKTMIIFRQKS